MSDRMADIRFTVVVPTRERCDTLLSTLRTCVMQDYGPLEILVSDNFSQDGTAAAVESFHDPRIRHVNTGRRVAMSTNFEFALSHIDTGFVLCIGDDDGLMPDAIADLAAIIREFECEAVTWRHARYGWPQCVDEAARNELVVPLAGPPRIRKTREVLDGVAAFRDHYQSLPGIYHACASHEAIRRACGEGGRLIHSCNPDVYTNIALGFTLEQHCHLPGPLTVNGVSRHSIGASFGREGNSGEAARRFLEEKPIPFHAKVAPVAGASICAAESLLQARDHLPAAAGWVVDIAALMEACLREAAPNSPGYYERAVEAIRAVGHANGLEDLAERVIARYPSDPAPAGDDFYGLHPRKQHFRLNAADFGVRDVHAAALLAKHTLVLHAQGHLSARGVARATWRLGTRKLARKLPWRGSKAATVVDDAR